MFWTWLCVLGDRYQIKRYRSIVTLWSVHFFLSQKHFLSYIVQYACQWILWFITALRFYGAILKRKSYASIQNWIMTISSIDKQYSIDGFFLPWNWILSAYDDEPWFINDK